MYYKQTYVSSHKYIHTVRGKKCGRKFLRRRKENARDHWKFVHTMNSRKREQYINMNTFFLTIGLHYISDMGDKVYNIFWEPHISHHHLQ